MTSVQTLFTMKHTSDRALVPFTVVLTAEE
jgi:hypothetical protein